jgi:uncharacterized LabA/DUF88 family protein
MAPDRKFPGDRGLDKLSTCRVASLGYSSRFRRLPCLARAASTWQISPEGSKKQRTPPLTNALIVEVHTMEEKGSDVNLAAHLLNDAWKDDYDVAAVISNDTDLVMPITMVTQERLKPVVVVCPGRSRMSAQLATVASFQRHIHPAMLASSQFADPIPRTTISKPVEW